MDGDAPQRGLVTPEAVRLEFEDATVGSRGVAVVIDWCIQLTALVLLTVSAGFLLQGTGAGLPPWVGVAGVALLSFLVLFGYPAAFETWWRGRTPGKAALGLRVVTVEGAPVGFRHAAVRAVLGLVDFLVTSGAAAVISALVSARHQRLGDHLAGTVVVRERTGAGRPQAATFTVPAGYEAYAAALDPAGVRPEDYQAVRSFLLRAAELHPDRRAALGERLARGLGDRIAHRRPSSVPAETFLRCLAARYQARRAVPGERPPAPASPSPPPGGGFAPPG